MGLGRAEGAPQTHNPLFVAGHEAKRNACLSVRKKTTGTYVPYYEQEKPFVCSRARSEAECPFKRSQKERALTRPTTNWKDPVCSRAQSEAERAL